MNKVLVFLGTVLALVVAPVVLTGCGKDGANGLNGSNGSNGKDGVDATPVTVVKLCPGTTTYPSVFVEVAFCVQHKLYAVYSANGGFETEIVPGYYSSNGIGSRCNFTVAPNCGIVW